VHKGTKKVKNPQDFLRIIWNIQKDFLSLKHPTEPLLKGMKRELIISTIWDMRMSPERLVKEFL